ncbi:MAG TPA: glycosyltransferase family 4 protein [Candidatus Acidoferrum sp.]
MRILIAIGVSRQKEAGAAGVVLNHAAELTKRGHAVDCWFLEDVLERPAKVKRFEALIFAWGVSRRIRLEPGKYDVVNIHAPSGCVYGAWRRRSRNSGAPPYVMTMQGSEERYVEAMGLEHRKGRAWNFGWKNRLWHRVYHQTMYDYSIKTANYGAVANREGWICAELKYKREPGLIWYVPNGVEERFFIAREFADKSVIELLFVGTWLDRKGVYYLADAFALAAKKNAGLRLTVAGCSRPADEVKKLFSAEVRERVNVIPFITREDIPALYAAHDVFVFPSLVEGMPLTLLEAIATGMPVVTTSTCGMADVVEDEVSGLLVPPADAEGLAAGIERLCESSELRKQLGLAGQDTVRRYTWERVTEKMEKIFVLAARNGRN